MAFLLFFFVIIRWNENCRKYGRWLKANMISSTHSNCAIHTHGNLPILRTFFNICTHHSKLFVFSTLDRDFCNSCWWFYFYGSSRSRSGCWDAGLWFNPGSVPAAGLCWQQELVEKTGAVFGCPPSGHRSSPRLPGPLSVPAHLHLHAAASTGPGCCSLT